MNLDLIRSATKIGGCPGLASRAPMPIAPIVQLSSDVEEVRVEVVAKESVGLSRKRPAIGGAHPQKKMKVSNHHKSRREGEGSKSCPSKGKEQVGLAGETQAPRPHHPRSVKKLDQISAGEGDVGYHTLRMTDLPLSDPDVPLEAQWPNLKQGTKVWVDGAASREYDRGVLIPRLAVDLYSSSSELLIDRALKSMVLVSILPNSSGFFPALHAPYWSLLIYLIIIDNITAWRWLTASMMQGRSSAS
ncbi:hypothetical protein B296_00043037 [Ensete ventricosum]|uniref:Uncharacterized protein n=1 Tax=Ensete ventricosum TaxID=4639 RepID=A0A426XMH0_ENSVE|nr:hypothetical protein B296_00043037 [Ensete ventricosum]